MILNLWENLKNSPAKRDKLVFFSFWTALILNLILWLILWLKFRNEQEFVVLRYNMYFGISSLGPWGFVFLMPSLGLLILGVDWLAARLLFVHRKILSYILAVAGVVSAICFLVAGLLIIYAN